MSYQVTIQSNNKQFKVNSEQTVLEAALEQGINLPYGCRNGFCGACKGTILAGEVSYASQPAKLTDQDISSGIAFLCSCRAESDLLIDVEVINNTHEIEIKLLPAKIQQMQTLAEDVMLIKLKLPDEERMQFLAGQYIDIQLSHGKSRSFSLANPPHTDDFLELHVRHVPGGLFTDQLFSALKVNDILRIEGPHGSFYYREDSGRPIIFMAGGTGFAPIKSIIEHLIAENIKLPMYLYWGVRSQKDLYMLELARQWQDQLEHFNFIPVLSDAEDDRDWNGQKGYVHETICRDFDDLSSFDIYACGPPIMIDSGEQAFLKQGMNKDYFYTDSFDYAAAAEQSSD